jgi:ring-1,2-phenylacetyl-CoA epoxidase subunit PaaE
MSKFYSLPVLSIRNLTSDAVCIKLDTSKFDADLFNFISGQYITIDHNINNEDVRRAYSISSSPEEGLEVGVKLVQGGLMSTFLNRELKLGDTLKVMPPVGDFFFRCE